MSSHQRLCRTCLDPEGHEEHFPIFEEDGKLAQKIFLCSGVMVQPFDSNNIPALICSVCMKDLSKAIQFRNKAIRAEKHFAKAEGRQTCDDQLEQLEPLVRIKLEDYDDDVKNIKSEPLYDDPNLEYETHIDQMVGLSEASVLLESTSFVDILSAKPSRSQSNREERTERRRSAKTEARDSGGSTSSGIVKCNLCMKTFMSASRRADHMKNVHGERTEQEMHKCNYCDRFFKLKIYLNRHVARVHGSQSKTACKKKSAQSIFNKEDVSLYCELCKQFFTTRGSLQKHVRVKHEFVDVKDRFVCDHCGSTFLIKYYLIRHIRVNHLRNFAEKRFRADQPTPCEVCGKILKNRGLLKPHMRSHKVMTADDYWYCDLCPRKFKTKGGCTWHISQRHILKATFPCKLCPGVVYRGKWELKCHTKSKHTNIRDFKCEICAKGFMDKQKLQIHTRIHTGERPHACHICPQTFIHQTDLRRHIWGHTGERPYKCNHANCGKGFMKRSELLNHENRCHPQQLPPQLPYQHYAM